MNKNKKIGLPSILQKPFLYFQRQGLGDKQIFECLRSPSYSSSIILCILCSFLSIFFSSQPFVFGVCVQNGTTFSFNCKVPLHPLLCEDIDGSECLTKVIQGVTYDCPLWDCTSPEILMSTSTVEVVEVRYKNYILFCNQGKNIFFLFSRQQLLLQLGLVLQLLVLAKLVPLTKFLNWKRMII